MSVLHQTCCSVCVLCLAYTHISQIHALYVTPRNALWGLLQLDLTLTCYYACVKAIHKAVSDSQKVRLEQHLDLLWERLLPLLYKWDRAFAVLDEELEALYEHMQAFHDQRVAPMETE